MEWLKDKKNLPIVVGLAVFVFLAAGGLIAFELGAFGGSSSPLDTASSAPAPVAGYPGAPSGGYPGRAAGYPGAAPGGYPGTASSGYPGTRSGGYPGSAPSTRPAAVVVAAKAVPPGKEPVNPLVGADPFALPNGRKFLPGAAALSVAGARPSLRDSLPPLNLFTIRPPRPEASVSFTLPTSAAQLLASTRVSGIVNAADGIFAVVEVNGTSQTVKPGDALPDGSKVASIQSSGVTLHTPGGGAITVPLSNGPPQQNTPIYGGGFGGGAYPGAGGFGGYPGAGGFGGGYPGGFGGGGYPGAGGFGGGGFGGGGGYPGAGGFGGGGGYPGGGGGGMEGGLGPPE